MGGSDDAPLAQADGEGGSRESFLIRKENRIPMKIPEIDVSYSIFTPSRTEGKRRSPVSWSVYSRATGSQSA